VEHVRELNRWVLIDQANMNRASSGVYWITNKTRQHQDGDERFFYDRQNTEQTSALLSVAAASLRAELHKNLAKNGVDLKRIEDILSELAEYVPQAVREKLAKECELSLREVESKLSLVVDETLDENSLEEVRLNQAKRRES
jgi:hypothetical protein